MNEAHDGPARSHEAAPPRQLWHVSIDAGDAKTAENQASINPDSRLANNAADPGSYGAEFRAYRYSGPIQPAGLSHAGACAGRALFRFRAYWRFSIQGELAR